MHARRLGAAAEKPSDFAGLECTVERVREGEAGNCFGLEAGDEFAAHPVARIAGRFENCHRDASTAQRTAE